MIRSQAPASIATSDIASSSQQERVHARAPQSRASAFADRIRQRSPTSRVALLAHPPPICRPPARCAPSCSRRVASATPARLHCFPRAAERAVATLCCRQTADTAQKAFEIVVEDRPRPTIQADTGAHPSAVRAEQARRHSEGRRHRAVRFGGARRLAFHRLIRQLHQYRGHSPIGALRCCNCADCSQAMPTSSWVRRARLRLADQRQAMSSSASSRRSAAPSSHSRRATRRARLRRASADGSGCVAVHHLLRRMLPMRARLELSLRQEPALRIAGA